MRKTVALALLLVSLVACTDELGAVDLTDANNGASITTPENQTINVKLDSNVTTGYKWNMVAEPDAKILKAVSSTYNPPIAGGIGAGGSETWQFRSTGRGTTSFRLAYFRPSNPNLVGKEFQLTITVQ